jgi:uncharacterized membrane protein YgdD (TMEM256/DUF423 family)
VQKIFLFIACVMGALAVAIGAFGAHGLKGLVEPSYVEIFNKGVTYQFYHVFALVACHLLASQKPSRMIKWAFWMFFSGIICFSGSLYLLALSPAIDMPVSILGPITPIGGLLFITGWILLSVYALRNFFGHKNLHGI